ncbi:hypothetical protein [Nitrosophilus alvini]|uniref:hypothetical protein n=1 Tax=Nitrosophilus alvini TaxID=2714855 RepID=UPI001909EB11|nr:hypothetical protein [Nitrosophilus alvini]
MSIRVSKILGILSIFLFFSFTHVHAQTEGEEIYQKYLYLSFEKIPKTIYKNEVFPVTLKIVVAGDGYESIEYDFENGKNIEEVFIDEPIKSEGIYLYKTLYFKAKSTEIRIPDITVTLIFEGYSRIESERLNGITLKTIELNPPTDFCGVLAKNMQIIKYKATPYDDENNLLVMNVEANLSNIENFHVNKAAKQGFESRQINFPLSNIVYYAIIPSQIDRFKIVYFNTDENRFKSLLLPIEVKDDRVSTQSDINPGKTSHQMIKMITAFSLSALFLLGFIYKKKIIYLLLALVFGSYGVYITVPVKKVCIKKMSNIYLLPTQNSTIFYKNEKTLEVKKLNHKNGYTKIILPDNKIGWVKDEDICKN